MDEQRKRPPIAQHLARGGGLYAVGKHLTPQLGITFRALDGKDLCRVAIQPSPRPVFIKEGQFERLYIRTGNSTRLLTTKEAIDYCKTRWKTA